MLERENTYLQSFLSINELVTKGDVGPTIKVVLHADKRPDKEHPGRYNLPSSSEVAILLPEELEQQPKSRVVICSYRDEGRQQLQFFNDTHRSYDPLTYPLLFPYGTDGFHLYITHSKKTRNNFRNVTLTEFAAFRLMLRPDSFNILQRSGRLFQQYIVDQWTKIETSRLMYIKNNQVNIYKHLSQYMLRASMAVGCQ